MILPLTESTLNWTSSLNTSSPPTHSADTNTSVRTQEPNSGSMMGGGERDSLVECLVLQSAPAAFDEALARCEQIEEGEGGWKGEAGGVLAAVYTQGQHDVVVSLAQRLAPPTGDAVWIGLRLEDSAGGEGGGRWVWVKGAGLRKFSKWAPGEPDGRGWIDPWLAVAVSQELWWVAEGEGHGAGEGRGSVSGMWGGAEWELAGVRCGAAPAGGLSSGGAVVDGELFVFGGMDSAARLSDTVTVLRPMSAMQLVARPVVTGLQPSTPSVPRQMVTITGANLCIPQGEAQGWLGAHACTRSTSLSEHHLLCQVPVGAGRALPVTIQTTQSHFISAPPAAAAAILFNYTPPVVFSIAPSSGGLDGKARMTVLGNSFGAADSLWKVSVGGTTCVASEWLSDSALTCTVPRPSRLINGPRVPVVVQVAGQLSMSTLVFEFTVPLPEIHGITSCVCLCVCVFVFVCVCVCLFVCVGGVYMCVLVCESRGEGRDAYAVNTCILTRTHTHTNTHTRTQVSRRCMALPHSTNS